MPNKKLTVISNDGQRRQDRPTCEVGKPLEQDGQPYARDFYQKWKTKKANYDKSSALRDFEALLEDASHLGKQSEILVAVQEWIFDIREFLREAKMR